MCIPIGLGGTNLVYRYLILDILGQGTFGQVVKCQNMKTHEVVAVKVVKNKPAYFNQSMMEVTILELVSVMVIYRVFVRAYTHQLHETRSSTTNATLTTNTTSFVFETHSSTRTTCVSSSNSSRPTCTS